MNEMILPQPLRPGDKVALVAPCSPVPQTGICMPCCRTMKSEKRFTVSSRAKTGAAKPAATTQSAAQPAAAQSAASGSGGAIGGDHVPFGSLKWTFGGKPNGSGARNGGVVISGARFSSRGVSFTYNHDLSAWGYSSGALGGVACLFVQKTNGQWVGGKFDWISSSRRSRGFENVFGGYAGWSLEGVPNPCAAAFVIVSPDGKRRSNVIAGTWSR